MKIAHEIGGFNLKLTKNVSSYIIHVSYMLTELA